MKKLHFFYSLVLIALLLQACNGKSGKPTIDRSTGSNMQVDTSDPTAVYKQLTGIDKTDIDTFYHRLYRELSVQNRYELLVDHMTYYSQLRRDDNAARAFADEAKGHAYNYLAKYDSGEVFLENAVKRYTELKLDKELAEAYGGLTTTYLYKGDYAKAFSYCYKSLAIYEQLKDSAAIFEARSDIALCLYQQKEYGKAIEITNACLSYFERHQDKASIATVLSILSICYYGTGNVSATLENARASLAIRRQLGNKHDISESLNNLSLAYMNLKMWDSATVALSESIDLMRQSNDLRQIPIIRQNMAVCLWNTGKKDEALANLNESIEEATTSGQKNTIANGYKQLYTLYRDDKDFEKALENYRKYKSWRDSLYSEEKTKAISELNIKYETQKKEKRIVELGLEKATKTQYLITSLLFLLLGFVIILLLADRNRKNKLLIEKVKAELEDNKRNLESFTDNIISKNKFIEELEQKLNAVTVQAEKSQEESEYLGELYQFKILTENDWTEFKIRFDKAYPGYINRLRQRFPDLAQGEQRQFLLIKLNIDNKECANMLGISADSVKKNRYRLKKKFNLGEEESLDDFVRSF